MLRAVAPDPGLLAWLGSPEGESWRRSAFKTIGFSQGAIASLKPDHECGQRCSSGWETLPYCDGQIRGELAEYGLSGVSETWKREWERACGALHEAQPHT